MADLTLTDNMTQCLSETAGSSQQTAGRAAFDAASNASVTAVDARVDTNESDITALTDVVQDNEDAIVVAEADIDNLEALTPEQVVVVKQASDLSGTLDSAKVYEIDGTIAMGSQTITVPPGGLTLMGRGNNVSCITTSETTFSLFIDALGDAGSLTLEAMDIKVDGASSKVFDIDNGENGGVIRIVNCTFTDCTEIGDLTSFRALLATNMVWFDCLDGITFHGDWMAGPNISGFVPIGITSGGTVFKEGSGLVFGSRFKSDARMELVSGATGYDFSPSNFTNDGDFELLAGTFSGAGTPVSGITNGDVKSKWRDNNGITNTYVGARWSLTTETATTVSSSGTYYKLAGTTTYVDEQWFSNTTNNAFVYDSTNPVDVIIQGTLSVSAGNNDELQAKLRLWDDSASSYVDIHEHGVITMSGSGAGENKAILGYATIEEGDRIELWMQNVGSTSNITMLEGTLISVSERAN